MLVVVEQHDFQPPCNGSFFTIGHQLTGQFLLVFGSGMVSLPLPGMPNLPLSAIAVGR
jgi:hypothetical protein